MLLEVIVQNGQEAIQAEQLGADRIELVSAIHEGGLTPSYGTIKDVLNSVSIPVQVMIRPHSYHYYYNDNDINIIRDDIQNMVNLGGKGIVFGALQSDNTINERILEKIIRTYPQLDITFHRAFDEVACQEKAYNILTKYKQVKRILTSGGATNCLEGKDNLKNLVHQARQTNGPKIMPGSGLMPGNISAIHRVVQADQYHFGKAVRMDQSFAKGFSSEALAAITKEIK